MALLRFYKNGLIVGSAENQEEVPILEIAEEAGIIIPRNCTSGTCGTCLIKLISGTTEIPDPLHPGLDEELGSQGYALACICCADGACDIELNPPL